MKNHTISRILGISAYLLMAAPHYSAVASVLYYNDGTIATDETFGSTATGVAWNQHFEPGGFLDGSADDTPTVINSNGKIVPNNTNTNRGLVTLQGDACVSLALCDPLTAVGGGFVQNVNLKPGMAGGGAQKGAVFIPYGSQAYKKRPAGVKWRSNFAFIENALKLQPGEGREAWKNGVTINGINTKLVKYTGDPLVSVSPDDVTEEMFGDIVGHQSDLQKALADDNVLVFFYEVVGQSAMDTLDLVFGDFEFNTGYQDVTHHYPYLAVLGDVGIEDFTAAGITISNFVEIEVNGDHITGGDQNQTFAGSLFVEMSDPIEVPAPTTATLGLLALGLSTLLGVKRRKEYGYI